MPGFVDGLRARAAHYGMMIGTRYAEPFWSTNRTRDKRPFFAGDENNCVISQVMLRRLIHQCDPAPVQRSGRGGDWGGGCYNPARPARRMRVAPSRPWCESRSLPSAAGSGVQSRARSIKRCSIRSTMGWYIRNITSGRFLRRRTAAAQDYAISLSPPPTDCCADYEQSRECRK